MKKQIVGSVIVLSLVGVVSISYANTGETLQIDRSEIREIFEKKRSGEDLSEAEQQILSEAKSTLRENKGKFFKKRMGLKNLSEEEKEALSSMTNEERKEFFESKREERKLQRQAYKNVVDKLIAGENLTSSEEDTRLEILAKISEKDPKREEGQVIAKLLAGDELSEAEVELLEEMLAKREAREAKRESR